MAAPARFVFQVDTTEPQNILDALQRALSPSSMFEFMENTVWPWVAHETASRFGAEGDSRSGSWEPLKESTGRFREWGGYDPDGPINVRSGELFKWVTESHIISADGLGVELNWPGESGDAELERKFLTAQQGDPDSRTPPRPVIAVDEGADIATIMTMLAADIGQKMAVWG